MTVWRRLSWLFGLAAANVLVRVHHLINANDIHADAGVVGMQAIHMLRGEWAPVLWGVAYQSSVDAIAMVPAFALFGATPLVAMAVPLFAHLLLTWLVWTLLQKHVGAVAAALACLPLIVAPREIEGVVLYAPRQWAILSIMVSLFYFDRARRVAAEWWLAGFFSTIALYLDLFTLQFGAAVAVAMVGAWLVADNRRVAIVASLGGALIGLIPELTLRWVNPQSMTKYVGLSPRYLVHNVPMLFGQLLPSLLSMRSYLQTPDLYLQPLTHAWPLTLLKTVAGLAFIALWLAPLARWERLTRGQRTLWASGSLGSLAVLCSCMMSPVVYDVWSARYLGPIWWLAPFALAVAPVVVPRRWVVLILSAFALSTYHSRMASLPTHFDGLLPRVADNARLDEVRALERVLTDEGVHIIKASFWTAYRLGFLWQDRIPVTGHGTDRYPPYHDLWLAADTRAWVFHPEDNRIPLEFVESGLQGVRYDKRVIGHYTVLILHR